MPHATAGHSPSGIVSVVKEREREKRRERKVSKQEGRAEGQSTTVLRHRLTQVSNILMVHDNKPRRIWMTF